MTIFVTGATGNIGSQIIRCLQDRNIDFTAGLTRKPETDPGYAYRQIDFADKTTLQTAFAGMEAVFAMVPVTAHLNVHAENILDAARAAGVGHIVRSSAIKADANADYALLRAHGVLDKTLEESGLSYTITKPSSFMQNYTGFLGWSIKSGTVYGSSADGRSGWIDVRDVGAVNAEVLTNPGAHCDQTYTLTGAERFTTKEGLSEIQSQMNSPIAYVDVPQEKINEQLTSMGMDDATVQYIASMEKATKDGVFDVLSDDVTDLLKRAPIPFRQFVREHQDAWRA